MSSTTTATEPSDRSGRQRSRRRSELLRAATQVFAEQGYHKASINSIIEKAGVARGTFYLYFSSKHKVFESILDEALSELRARIVEIDVTPGARPPSVQLRENITRIIEYVTEDHSLTTILLNPGLGPADDVSSKVRGFYDDVHELLESSLSYGVEIGLVRQCDIQLVAAATLGAIRGVCLYVINAPEAPDLEQVTDGIINFALFGVIPAGQKWG